MPVQTQHRFAPVGSASLREKPTSKLSIMNPFRKNPSSNTLPPPAYSTNPSSSASVATSKRKPSSLFSWKSSRLSWGGFGSSKGQKSEQVPVVNKSQRKGKSAPAMPSAASNVVSIWKRRDPQVEFEFQPPFVVEFDPSTPATSTPEPSTAQPNRSLSPPTSLSFPSRTTYSPSPVPSVSFDSKLAKSIPRATHSSAVFPSQSNKPISKSDIRTFKIVEEVQEVQPSPSLPLEIRTPSSAPQASPDIKNAFADKFPLPPARRPSSAELVATSKPPTSSSRSIPLPTKSLLAPSRNSSSTRPMTSSLPRPKNGPYTASNPYPSSPTNSAFKSRLPTPSIASTTSSPSLDTRSPSRTSIPLPSNRKPIVIPARVRPSETSPQSRVSVLANNDDRTVRNSWSSSTTAMRNSGASGDSDDTAAEPIDLRKRTSLIIPVVVDRPEDTRETYSGQKEAVKEVVDVEEEKRRFEKEVEEMFSETRMKDLLIQLGI